VSHSFGLLIESLVAVLLTVTIGYCVVLNRRLHRLRSDEMSLKATISELITATEIAERAVGGLKVAARDCDNDLGERLLAAERFTGEIARQIAAGEQVLARLARIAAAARTLREAEPPDATATLAAASAFADRARTRVASAA
jgi:hypothetical protein